MKNFIKFIAPICALLLTGCTVKTSDSASSSVIVISNTSSEESQDVSTGPLALPITLNINNSIGDWTFVPDSAEYPDPSYYKGGGLKLNVFNKGLISPQFVSASSVSVTLSISSMNGKNNPQGGASHVFELKALDASNNVVDTDYQDTISVGDLSEINLTGEGIVKVSIIMVGYYSQDGANQTLELSKVSLR